ncbi:carbohydrate kinase family protein [Streptomyces sp. NPDC101178]|uniref:carbohydrate kinase family protein n=1 Tax=Streptomyces sp. NPDC101178 TaxID=3366124 RepID=UPI00380CF44A
MRIAITGSIATDHLMTFPGRFAEQLLAKELDHVSLSFLADDLEVRRGGVAANISYGLGLLKLHPLLVASAGTDFDDYRAWLDSNGVDTGQVRVSTTRRTARFICTTDEDHNQIATFYPGAMAEASMIDLTTCVRRAGGVQLAVIGPDDPDAMIRHTTACRSMGLPFAADPSQQLARLGRAQARCLVDGARYLFTNEYEAQLLLERTGWTEDDVLRRVGMWLTTRGKRGVTLSTRGSAPRVVRAVATDTALEPTGVGDAFRAGFLAGLAWRQPEEVAGRLGCAMATAALEAVGPQEYTMSPAQLRERTDRAYGPDAESARLLSGGPTR